MALGDVVRSNNEAIILGQTGRKCQPKTFIGWPGATCDDAFAACNEMLHLGERLGLFGNSCHAVETRVATHRDIVHAATFKAFCRGFILHEEMVHCLQLLAEPTAIPAEEITVGLEDKGDIEQWNTSLFQSPHVVEPKLILDEKRGHKMMALHPCLGVAWRISGQIENFISQRIILSHLIPRRGKERQQNLELGMCLFYSLNDRSALFKLAQRGGMEPDPLLIRPFDRLKDLSLAPFHP